MRVLLYAKLLKETETEETIVFFVTFLSLVGPGPQVSPGYAYGSRFISLKLKAKKKDVNRTLMRIISSNCI